METGYPNNTTIQGPDFYSRFTDFDIYLFKAGRHFRLYEKLGAHAAEHNGTQGTYFAVWAPNAKSVSVTGNFNFWTKMQHPLFPRWDESGIWEGFIPNVHKGELYKYAIQSADGRWLEKADPFAFYCEIPPKTASVVWSLEDYAWQDKTWLDERKRKTWHRQPVSVYEVHLGSWRRVPSEGSRPLTYRELAHELAAYVQKMGFTHVEFMPVMEHPFYGSWGYQITGYYAPTARYGCPQDFMYLIDVMHQAGIGVILDWVPSHFPGDEHALFQFDGTHLYEHADPRQGFHPDWKSYIFNYGRNEVRSFLISNALFWLGKYHVDALRVDAVASMLYLDYSRKEGEWIPNRYGGRENLDAISFLKEFNETVYREHPDVFTVAEESTAWPGVSRPTYQDGLGFGQKWMMGWMHDTLQYFKRDPIYRSYHQDEITFSIVYAFTENFMLPLSHDEVVYGKGSLLSRMPGDDWQKFANLRLLFTYMFTHPGTRLLFMGGEFGQWAEWNHEQSLDWHLLEHRQHQEIQTLVAELNRLYRNEPALYQRQFEADGFEWVDYSDRQNSVIVYLRKGYMPDDQLAVICNFTPTVHYNYRIGVPYKGLWKEVFNSDYTRFGGSGVVNNTTLGTEEFKCHGKDNSLLLTLPPLAAVVLKPYRAE